MQTATDTPLEPYITKLGNRAFLVDEEANRIQFLDSRFYQCADGSMVPSVTTILEAWPKGHQYEQWLKKHGEDADDIRDEAGRRGSTVHNLTETLDYGGTVSMMDADGNPKYKMLEWAMLERYVDFRKTHAPDIRHIELNLASSWLGYAGTLDRLMVIDGDLWLVDIKTSAAVHDNYHLQTAAYLNLCVDLKVLTLEEATRTRRGILWLNAKTRTYGKGDAIQGPGWQMVESPRSWEEDSDLFEAMIGVWHITHKNDKPKNIQYNLKHQL